MDLARWLWFLPKIGGRNTRFLVLMQENVGKEVSCYSDQKLDQNPPNCTMATSRFAHGHFTMDLWFIHTIHRMILAYPGWSSRKKSGCYCCQTSCLPHLPRFEAQTKDPTGHQKGSPNARPSGFRDHFGVSLLLSLPELS
ncbi:unnamed protein product [Durusdinium trenchii]|uniref:Uncharacterized protein n=1 Tax=Durusdinium trenchii TaxID=1381693 RepID=A0ABP0PVT6_9DINO